MRYMGGKTRIASRIASVINEIKGDRPVWDAFCGGLATAEKLNTGAGVYLSDACAPLINLWRAVRDGWVPPYVTYSMWVDAKELPDTDPLKAFAGFGCSFGGRWFTSYAFPSVGPEHDGVIRHGPNVGRRNMQDHVSDSIYRVNTHRPLLRDALGIEQINWMHVEPGPTNRVLYLDPPYFGTECYDAVTGGWFDHGMFRHQVREWSRYTDVFVSEYDFPFGEMVMEVSLAAKVAGGERSKERKLDRLYYIAKGSL